MFFSRCGAGCKGSKRTRRLRQLRPESKKTLVLAVVLLPLVCVDSRARVAALVVASDPSDKGMEVVRTTSITFKGREALSRVQNPAVPVEDRLGLIELSHSAGTARQALANLNVRPAVYVAARLSESNNQPLRTAWPDAFFFQDDKDIDKSQCQRWVFVVCTSPCGWWLAPPPP